MSRLSDIDKLTKVFKEMGVEHVVCNKENSWTQFEDKHDATILLSDGTGYSGFYCELFFNKGKFLDYGCWE